MDRAPSRAGVVGSSHGLCPRPSTSTHAAGPRRFTNTELYDCLARRFHTADPPLSAAAAAVVWAGLGHAIAQQLGAADGCPPRRPHPLTSLDGSDLIAHIGHRVAVPGVGVFIARPVAVGAAAARPPLPGTRSPSPGIAHSSATPHLAFVPDAAFCNACRSGSGSMHLPAAASPVCDTRLVASGGTATATDAVTFAKMREAVSMRLVYDYYVSHADAVAPGAPLPARVGEAPSAVPGPAILSERLVATIVSEAFAQIAAAVAARAGPVDVHLPSLGWMRSQTAASSSGSAIAPIGFIFELGRSDESAARGSQQHFRPRTSASSVVHAASASPYLFSVGEASTNRPPTVGGALPPALPRHVHAPKDASLSQAQAAAAPLAAASTSGEAPVLNLADVAANPELRRLDLSALLRRAPRDIHPGEAPLPLSRYVEGYATATTGGVNVLSMATPVPGPRPLSDPLERGRPMAGSVARSMRDRSQLAERAASRLSSGVGTLFGGSVTPFGDAQRRIDDEMERRRDARHSSHDAASAGGPQHATVGDVLARKREAKHVAAKLRRYVVAQELHEMERALLESVRQSKPRP